MRRFAFPVLDAVRAGTTHMVEVAQDVLPRVCDVLHARATRTGRGARAWPLYTHASSCTSTTTATIAAKATTTTTTAATSMAAHALAERALHCHLHIGTSVTVPLTVLGAVAAHDTRHTASSSSNSNYDKCNDDDDTPLLLHSPGLAGGFVVTLRELATCRGYVDHATPPRGSSSSRGRSNDGDHNNDAHDDGTATHESCELGMVCLMQALYAARSATSTAATTTASHGTLERLYRMGRRRHYAVCGLARLRACTAQLHRRALRFSFPYHCGGVHAAKRYMDVRDEVCDIALDNNNDNNNNKDNNDKRCGRRSDGGAAVRVVHGVKVLSSFGTAVLVGVGDVDDGDAEDDDDDDDVSLPTVYWHATGATAACVSPLLHGCRLLTVGAVPLAYNGPTRDCTLLQRDDVRMYMNVSSSSSGSRCDRHDVDTTRWLCEGLYGVTPGEVWRHRRNNNNNDLVVAGVAYDAVAHELDLLLRDTTTGALELADEL